MASCQSIPVSTLYTPSVTETLGFTQSTSTETIVLPDSTTTFALITQSCTNVDDSFPFIKRGANGWGFPARPTKQQDPPPESSSCTNVVVTTTSIIPGAIQTIYHTAQVPIEIQTTILVPTETVYSTDCVNFPTNPISTDTGSETMTETTSSIPTASPSTFPDTSTSTGLFFLSTPSPTTFLTASSMTASGSVLFTTFVFSSQPPPSTIYNVPTGHATSDTNRDGPMIGGIVGGVAVLCIILGAMLWLWRKKQKQAFEAQLTFENNGSGSYGKRLELEIDDDDEGRPYNPYRTAGTLDRLRGEARNFGTQEPTTMVERAPILLSTPSGLHPNSQFLNEPENLSAASHEATPSRDMRVSESRRSARYSSLSTSGSIFSDALQMGINSLDYHHAHSHHIPAPPTMNSHKSIKHKSGGSAEFPFPNATNGLGAVPGIAESSQDSHPIASLYSRSTSNQSLLNTPHRSASFNTPSTSVSNFNSLGRRATTNLVAGPSHRKSAPHLVVDDDFGHALPYLNGRLSVHNGDMFKSPFEAEVIGKAEFPEGSESPVVNTNKLPLVVANKTEYDDTGDEEENDFRVDEHPRFHPTREMLDKMDQYSTTASAGAGEDDIVGQLRRTESMRYQEARERVDQYSVVSSSVGENAQTESVKYRQARQRIDQYETPPSSVGFMG